jgi:hypothetical protein
MDLMNDDRRSWTDRTGQASERWLDMAVATRTSVPVLISAPPDSALPMALEIAVGRGVGGAGGVVVVEAADNCHLQSTLTRASETNLGTLRTIVVQDVETLDHAQQSVLMALVGGTGDSDSRACRIIATTSVPLFERVRQGSFDSELFYRLNRIHIKVGAHPPNEH